MGGDVRERKRVLGSRVEGDVFLCVCLLFFQLLSPFLNRKNTMVAPLKQPNRNHLPPTTTRVEGEGLPQARPTGGRRLMGCILLLLHHPFPPFFMTSDLASLEVGQGGVPRRRMKRMKKARSRHPGLTSQRPPASPRVDLISILLFFFEKSCSPSHRHRLCLAMPKARHSRCRCEARRGPGHPPRRRRRVVEKSSIFFPPLLPFVESTK